MIIVKIDGRFILFVCYVNVCVRFDEVFYYFFYGYSDR